MKMFHSRAELKFYRIRFLMFIIVLFLISGVGAASDTLPLRISGSAEFKLKYAFGEGGALTGTGYSLGRPDISQLLSLRVQGQITPDLAVSANLDNRRGGNLQMLELRLDGEPISGRIGGFSVKSRNPYTTYSGRLRGVELSASLTPVQLGLSAGRVQGIAAKKTFRGSSAEETIVYHTRAPYGPSPTDSGFEASLEGMQYYILEDAFDPDYMQTWFLFEDEPEEGGRTLLETLGLWDLDYLYHPELGEEGGISAGSKLPLAEGQFATISSSEELLALKMESKDILRGQIQALIRAYNVAHGLTGADKKQYPFNFASEAERVFLSDLLSRHTHIVVGMENKHDLIILQAKADSYRRQSLYDLGQTGIEPGSVQIEVRKGTRFLPIETELPLLFQVEYGQGIIEFDFPDDFFEIYDAIRVRYTYEIAQGIFSLGLSIVEGSEKVYLNDVLLAQNSDYLLDYELGILTVFRMLSPEDVIRVEYEYFRGPFGRIADYKSNFYAVSAGWTPNDNLQLQLELAAYADQAKSAQAPDLTPTMPNTHLIAGLSGQYQRDKLMLSADAALSHNTFPFDDNLKTKAPNKITAIMNAADGEGKTYLLLGHNNGISAGAEIFRNYSVGAGLSSPTVRGLAAVDETWFFATDQGLTVFTAVPGPSGQTPFDYISNWKRINTLDGLPSNDITAITTTPWQIWVGTGDGYLAVADIETVNQWTRAHFGGGPVLALVHDPAADLILAGTAQGLFASDGSRFRAELEGVEIDVLWSSFLTVNGIHSFAAGGGLLYARQADGNWTTIGAPDDLDDLLSLTVWQERLWVGTTNGLYVWDGTTWDVVSSTTGYSITSLGAGPGYKYGDQEVLWAGTEGKTAEGPGAANTIAGFEILERAAVSKHDGAELAVAADNPGRYMDLERNAHTASGYAARIQGKYDLENGSIYGSYETLDPGFTKIAQSSRQATDVLRVGTQWSVSPQVGITAEHARTSTKASFDPAEPGRRTKAATTKIAGTLDFGPQINVALSLAKTEDGRSADSINKEQALSVAGRNSFFNNRLAVSAAYENSKSENPTGAGNASRQTILRGDAKLSLDGFTLSGSYRKPVKTIDPGGANERMSGITETRFDAQWNRQVGTVGLRARYNQTSRSNIATLKTFANNRAELRLTLPNIPMGGGQLTPGVVLQWDNTVPFSGQPRRGITAQANITGDLANMRTTTGFSLKRMGYTGTDKLVLDTEIFTSLNFSAEKALRPQFDLRWKRSKSERPDLGTAVTDSLSGTARLLWVPAQGIHNTASAVYTLSSSAFPAHKRTHGLTLQNTLNYTFSEKITLTGSANLKVSSQAKGAAAEKPAPDIRCSLTGRLNYRLNEIWSLGTTFGYHRHNIKKEAGPNGGAFTLEAGLKATF